MITLFIDADACPVKREAYRFAERHARKGTALEVFVVSNSPIAVPRDEFIERVSGLCRGSCVKKAEHPTKPVRLSLPRWRERPDELD